MKRETRSETPAFTARDVKGAAGLSYRQLNDWDARGALPSQREQEAGWRKFSIRELFVLMICSDIRKRFGVPLEKLARLKAFMLQKDVDHFNAALRMMKYGLAVFILTDLEEIFVMDADFAIAELLELGYCRYDARQAYVFLCVNPLVNRMLAALKEPVHMEISDRAYDARWAAEAKFRVQDEAELAVLESMRNPDIKRFSVKAKGEKEVILEVEQELPEGVDPNTILSDQNFQTLTIKRHQGKNVRVFRTLPKRLSREKLRKLVAVQLDD